MRPTLRSFIGTLILVTLVIVYAIFAVAFAVAKLSESGPLVHFSYFLLSGLLWVLPAMLVVKWMVGKPKA